MMAENPAAGTANGIDEGTNPAGEKGQGGACAEGGGLPSEIARKFQEHENVVRSLVNETRGELLSSMSKEVHRQFHVNQTALAQEMQRQLELVHQHFVTEMHRQFVLLDQRLEDRFTFSSQTPPTADEQARILELAAHFAPKRLRGLGKVRIGADHDGGYILADRLADSGGEALSLGVADEVSWDVEMAEAGYLIHQYDHTVDGPPSEHVSIRFAKTKIVAVPESGGATIAEALAAVSVDATDLILKMDIEGDEWQVLEGIDDVSLSRFSQIVCEFHEFRQIGDDAWFQTARAALEKLSRSFDVVHVHANNYGALTALGNVPFPDLLEVTFVNRDRFETEEGTEYFPTSLDRPNRGDRPDIFLGTFRFPS
ncbi:FkbM family methyltransferase [Amorphus coralli]|uniref:FkbM family methyltransferase n=1 Tax=Amorphus coralli TaxID=340680 RepID=UPI00146B937C|nr:FkbM family methyltransferase [Amorphus coralli]